MGFVPQLRPVHARRAPGECPDLADGRILPADEFQFMLAMQRWRERHRGRHPDCRDVLAVAKALGYARETPAWRPAAGGPESAKGQLSRIVEALTEDEAEELVRVVLELGGPSCPNCGALVKGLRLVWAPSATQVKQVVCGKCGHWFFPGAVI